MSHEESLLLRAKKTAFSLARAAGAGGPYWLSRSPFLARNGWFRSFRENTVVDGDGNALPWWPYAFRLFLEPRLGSGLRVFEYGSGYSSLWLARKVGAVESVEHSEEWAGKMSKVAPANLTIVSESDPVSYVRSCAKNAPWDVVVIDGINRKECCLEAASHLTDGGVVIFDDTERPQYWHVVLEMREKGFRNLSIMGLGALSNEAKQTTILYRPDNCLGI